MLETIYGYETTALSRLYDEFLQRVLPFVFNLDDSIYHKEKTALLLSSKAIQLNSLMAKKRAHAMLENDSSLFSKLVTSTQTIQATRNKLAGANHTNAEVEQLKTELNSHLIENMMLRYRADLKSGKHDLKVFQDNFALASCEKIQDELDTDEAILEYFVLDNGWGQLLILPDTSMCFYTGGDELSAKIKQERYAVMTGNESTDIGQTLLSAVMPYLDNITELLIIPDGELHFIPFECMKTENGMLIERFAVSYVYSASLWYNLRRTSDENKPENLLTIAPVFNENTEAYVSEYWGNRAIGPLPYSREEVMGIESV
ncbi:MAG TPA: CHAT domain-containing protein, partial [Bacteroidales bacterium]|nr:CHAT domain-containing protein [Bacteroidales bacterium]